MTTMTQVSIAQVENLLEAVEGLKQACSSAQDNFDSKMNELSELHEATETEFQEAVQMEESASCSVNELAQQLQESQEQRENVSQEIDKLQGELQSINQEMESVQEELHDAEMEMEEAQDNLQEAQSALEESQSSRQLGEDNEDGDDDCSSMADDVEEAEEEVANIQENIDGLNMQLERLGAQKDELNNQIDILNNQQKELDQRISFTQKQLEKVQQVYQQAQKRTEIDKDNCMRSRLLFENYGATGSQMLTQLNNYVENGIAHLNKANEALEGYLATNAGAASMRQWKNWQPQQGAVVSPKDIHDRMSLSPEVQKEFSNYLYERDSSFRSLCDRYSQRFNEANGFAEKHAVRIQAISNISGEFAEKLVAYALSPLGKVTTQNRTYFEDGRYTKTDILLTDLKNNVILGKGEGRWAPVGGSIAAEVKTGQASYIASQKEHMEFQAGGHQTASCSVVFCSRDIKDLSENKEDEVRSALKNAGSPIFATLPRKGEIDAAVWDTIINIANGSVKEEGE